MAYTDIEFYKTKYYGDNVPDESLERYLEKASDRIDAITFGRLVNGLPGNERAQTKIKKAVCAVADCLYQIDEVKKASMATVETVTREDGTITGKMISSVSSGAESISYVTGISGNSADIYSKAAMDKKAENVLLRQVATEYLGAVVDNKGVCLLYAGL